jgi:D-aspartate ligase
MVPNAPARKAYEDHSTAPDRSRPHWRRRPGVASARDSGACSTRTERHSGGVKRGPTSLPAMILGKHITGLGALRTLARRGLETYGLEATDDIITRSRWYRPAEARLAETTDSETLDRFLSGLSIERAVLITASDRWTLAAAGLPDATRRRFPVSLGSRDTVERFIDKDRFRDLLATLPIPAPRSRPIAAPEDIERASDEELESAFLKPTDSQAHRWLFGTKGAFIPSRDWAVRHVAEAAKGGVQFMLQEWVPGGSSQTVLLDGFVDRTGEIRGLMARRRIRNDPPQLANTSCDVTIPLHEVEGAVASVRTLLGAVPHRGVFNAEFKYDARDGLFKIIEVNTRLFWFNAHCAKAGLDLPWMSYLDAQELPVPTVGSYQVGRYGLYGPPDGAAIVRALASRRRPSGPVLRPWLLGDHAAFWWNDPVPGLIDAWYVVRRRLGDAFAFVRTRARRRGPALPGTPDPT